MRPGLAALGLACTIAAGCESITRDELRCEEAMSHLARCCPGVARSPVECAGTGTLPFIEFPNVGCLVDVACADIQSRGICDWAQSPTGPVCP